MLKKYVCEHCGHKWIPRPTSSKITQCPKCHSSGWNASGSQQINLKSLSCAKCKHEWIPRIPNPRLCPNCRTAYWEKSSRNRFGGIRF